VQLTGTNRPRTCHIHNFAGIARDCYASTVRFPRCGPRYIAVGPYLHRVSATIARGKRPVPSRTRKLSLSAPMVLRGPLRGRVGRRRTQLMTRVVRFAERPSSYFYAEWFDSWLRQQVAVATAAAWTEREATVAGCPARGATGHVVAAAAERVALLAARCAVAGRRPPAAHALPAEEHRPAVSGVVRRLAVSGVVRRLAVSGVVRRLAVSGVVRPVRASLEVIRRPVAARQLQALPAVVPVVVPKTDPHDPLSASTVPRPREVRRLPTAVRRPARVVPPIGRRAALVMRPGSHVRRPHGVPAHAARRRPRLGTVTVAPMARPAGQRTRYRVCLSRRSRTALTSRCWSVPFVPSCDP
jgi:hypothetical protein